MISLWKHELAREPKPTPRQIASEIAERHGYTLEDLKGQSRLRPLVHARQEAMATIYARCNVSTSWVGRFFGDRDHTTVIHAIRQVEKRSVKSPGDERSVERAHTAQ